MDWRAYQETHGLTEKQQKLATKVRKRELRIANLQTEMERIKVPPQSSATLSLHQSCGSRSDFLSLLALAVHQGSAGSIPVHRVQPTRQVSYFRHWHWRVGALCPHAASMSHNKARS